MSKTIYLIIILFVFIQNNLITADYNKKYNDAIELSVNGKFEKSNQLFNSILQSAYKTNNHELKLDCINAIGYNYELLEEYEKSLKMYSKGILLIYKQELFYYNGINYIFKNYANLNSFLGNYITALNYYKICAKIAEDNGDMLSLIDFKICIAAEKKLLGLNQQALNDLNKIEMLIEQHDYKNKLDLTNKIAYYLNCIDLNLELNNLGEVKRIYNKINNNNYYEFTNNEYYFNFSLIQLKSAIANNNKNVDSVYKSIDQTKLTESELRNLNCKYKLYGIEKNRDNKELISELKTIISYYEHHKELNNLIPIYNKLNQIYNTKLPLDFTINLNFYNEYINQKNTNLNNSLISNNRLEDEIKQLKNNIESKQVMINIIIFILILSFILSFSLATLYNKQKKINKLIDEKVNINIKDKKIKMVFTNSLIELQNYIYNNDYNLNENKHTELKTIFKNFNKIRENLWIFPTNYNWIGNILTFDYDDTDTDGVWIQFKQDGTPDFVTILQVIGSNPKSCQLDPSVYGTSGEAQGAVKPKTNTGFGPRGGKINITNQPF